MKVDARLLAVAKEVEQFGDLCYRFAVLVRGQLRSGTQLNLFGADATGSVIQNHYGPAHDLWMRDLLDNYDGVRVGGAALVRTAQGLDRAREQIEDDAKNIRKKTPKRR